MYKPDSGWLWLLKIIAFLGVVAFIMWLSLRPNDPIYTILDFTAVIPNSGVNQGGENGAFFFSIEFQNPNKDSSIYYDDSVLTFNYNEELVGQQTITHFHQGRDKRDTQTEKVDVISRVWKTVINAISNNTIELNAQLVTEIRFRTWGIKSKHHKMHMEGKVKIGSDGKLFKKKKIKLKHAEKLSKKSTSSLRKRKNL